MISQEAIINKLKEESKVYNNFGVIMEKADSDGYLTIFLQTLKFVFQKEMTFAVSELKKMKKTKKNIDIKQLLETNIYIFKENIKIILNNCVDQIWGMYMQKDFVDNFILKEVYKAKNSIIEEIDEENFTSENKSQTSKFSRKNNIDDLKMNKTHENLNTKDKKLNSKSKSKIRKKCKTKIRSNNNSKSKLLNNNSKLNIRNIDILIPDKRLSSNYSSSPFPSSLAETLEENKNLSKNDLISYSCKNSPKNELKGFQNFDYTNHKNKFIKNTSLKKKINSRPLTERNTSRKNIKNKKFMNFDVISKNKKKNKNLPIGMFSSNNHIKISININNDKNKNKSLFERIKKTKIRGISEKNYKKYSFIKFQKKNTLKKMKISENLKDSLYKFKKNIK